MAKQRDAASRPPNKRSTVLQTPTNPFVPASAGFFMANRKSRQRLDVEQVLRSKAGEPLTKEQIAAMTGTDVAFVSYVVGKLMRSGLKHRRRGNTHTYWYEPQGATPATRLTISKESFHGVDWSYSTARPGCQDFLKYPSRRGDTLHPYKEPLLNASSAVTKKGDKK